MDIYLLIKKFWQKKTTAAEDQRLLELMENDHLLKQEMENAFTSLRLEDKIAQQRWKNLEHKIKHTDSPKKLFHINKWMYAAASIIIILSGTLIYLNNNNPAAEKPQFTLLKNDGRNNKIVWLGDSTKIELFAQSSIAFTDSFNIINREVLLTGKAKFDVRKNAGKPFTVVAQNITTTVLGTSFTIDPSGNNLQIQLHEGKIIISGNTATPEIKNIYLNPGDVFTLNQHTKEYAVKSNIKQIPEPQPEKKIKRITGVDFYKEDLADVFDQLQNHYQVNIRFNKEELKGLKFTGRFSEKDRIENILTIVTSLHDMRYTLSGKTFVIQKD